MGRDRRSARTEIPNKERKHAGEENNLEKISDDAVRAKTDRVWQAWFSILDKFGAKEKGHTQAAKFLREKHGLSDWWAQAVTIRYEWERGLRSKESADDTHAT